MKIQSILEAWSPEKMNEDHIYIWENTFWVFDGASSLIPFKSSDWETWWYLASKIAKEIFEKYSHTEKSLEELYEIINEEIREKMIEVWIDTQAKEWLWCTTAASIRIDKDYINWTQITDASIIVIYHDWTHIELSINSNHDVESLTKWMSLWDLPQKEKRKQVDDIVIWKRKRQNIDYWVLSWESEYKKFLNSWKISKKDIASIILFTDGLIPCKTHPESEDDYSQFVEIYRKSGLLWLHKWHRNIEKNDPECTKFPRFKMHDDIWAISIDF